ncbi:hypothetical protein TVAG_205180 [Trichomonas vaginalis G3]|uniref:UBA domain-containing protein n=1 Tax=Trichomonas vaginalis (strain ATCC PRA-98 / G3) TaxID=412133 RepID=A2G9T7_TRIV3|nr:UBA-like family [Trichomonas vaginalis G3]XP_051106482.1 UBA-like family [Trichomonas vaginalis G3]EAX86079.1 hypothetical protein TVAG_205180 [Trichomonas vaginalis G3]KAI5542188.1 UBA-like family [Trichomonas vaginalis G3]KAI5542770.1 UBA-like family [Trichomonas vaginalis G3]|eukprot:XP_001299009.1 hypothetical protein [Trichomonas vaginalis G3]
MDPASKNDKHSDSDSDEEDMKDNRVLLPPRTTYYYNQMFPNHNDENNFHYDENKLYDDPPNMQELVENVLEIGVSQETAVRALRLANYNFVDACLLIDEDSLGDGSLESSKSNNALKPNSNNQNPSQINRIPKEWLEQLSTREQAELTRLFKKYGIVETIRDVYLATGYDEQIADNILSQYIK